VTIEACGRLREECPELPFRLDLAGPVARGEDEAYRQELLDRTRELNLGETVRMLGPIPYPDVPALVAQYDLVVNLFSGSLDKTSLEAMACAVPVVTSNRAISRVVSEVDEELVCDHSDVRTVTHAIAHVLNQTEGDRRDVGMRLRGVVERDHSIGELMEKLVDLFEDVVS